ncbi:Os06g0543500 [Oryza sativa Japonica Group]|uniref:Os06g0543500 protein n=1 Tax=Oryza sativa subsp. japonica TaxID=39947 RepID=A0A0P0WXK2_ORYSJ|nr:hypothetical protein EE612_034745 [Oryza sativa]BAS98139.1 Os06g0543500 [Oryza sativa Japonica Group]
MTSSRVSSNTLAEMASAPFCPFRVASMLTWQSLVRAVKLTIPAISCSLAIMSATGAPDTKRILSPRSSNSPDRSKLGDDAMMSNACACRGAFRPPGWEIPTTTRTRSCRCRSRTAPARRRGRRGCGGGRCCRCSR